MTMLSKTHSPHVNVAVVLVRLKTNDTSIGIALMMKSTFHRETKIYTCATCGHSLYLVGTQSMSINPKTCALPGLDALHCLNSARNPLQWGLPPQMHGIFH